MANLELAYNKKISPFRRLAIGTWKTAYDPSVYGTMQLRMDPALAYVEAFRQKTGLRLTVSHLFARAAAEVLKEMPEANAVMRFNRIYLRKRIGVFFQVTLRNTQTGKFDLSGATLFDLENKSLSEIVKEMDEKILSLRNGTDEALEKSRRAFRFVPLILMNFALKLISFLSYTLNLDLSFFGLPKDAFGSIMVTNIGSLGLEAAYVPLVPYSRVPILLAMGAVKQAPVVVGGKVVPARVMDVNVTFDHRFIEGAHAAQMANILRSWIEEPEEHFGQILK